FVGVCAHLDLHSFPTRRSSDLVHNNKTLNSFFMVLPPSNKLNLNSLYTHRPRQIHTDIFHFTALAAGIAHEFLDIAGEDTPNVLDRKSTRLNSSHVKISYAVFC